jgi:uncharacterized protein (TIGR03435 family)
MEHRVRTALLLAGTLITQSLRAQSPTFDVVSIKPHVPGRGPAVLETISTMIYRDGRMTATNATAQGLVAYAYRTGGRNLLPSQLLDGPAWMTSTRFDIVATASAEMNKQEFTQLPAAVLAMLEDRFKLVTHVETRTQAVYALVKARSDGRLGPQIRPSAIDCLAIEKERANGPRPTVQELMATTRPCTTKGFRDSAGFASDSITLLGIAEYVNAAVDRPVLDRTGLAGYFEATLRWANPTPASPGDAATGTAPVPSEGPSVFTALQEQLGLKLEPRQEPIDMRVIDHIELPTPN